MSNHFVTNLANKVKDDQCLAVNFNGYCNWCRKYGHKEIECLVKRNGGGRAGPPHNGNNLGRYERVPGNPYNGTGKGGRNNFGRVNGGRGGRNGRGRGKGLHGGNGCRYCGSADHWGNECPKNKTEHSYTCLLATKDVSGNLKHRQVTSVMVDSGATSHMKRDTEGLVNIRRHYGHVYVANGEKLEVRYIGDWLIEVKHSDGTIKGVMFKDVIVVPNLSRDLLSMARIDKAGGDVIIREGKGSDTSIMST
ncbi:integrase core domain protein [Nannochloropsis gaditana]|uniref:Integrase core domain protein n=1 Tax=Nannochloropsis gaditana TaxID=72520 RepID=W7T193_9STRA|nr:integrase core domain protein [Nannochloropsis gaditana]